MKTFKTEKNNIPQGATHYRNECDKRHFLWVKIDGDDVTVYIDSEGEFLSANWLKGGKYIGSVKPIPKTKDVEWVNGDVAIYDGSEALVIAYHPHHPSVVIEMPNNEYLNVLASELSKPETEAERFERERLENGEAMYMQHCKNLGSDKFYWNEKNPASKEAWCKLAEQYRKGE